MGTIIYVPIRISISDTQLERLRKSSPDIDNKIEEVARQAIVSAFGE
jgi:hypothetical protein